MEEGRKGRKNGNLAFTYHVPLSHLDGFDLMRPGSVLSGGELSRFPLHTFLVELQVSEVVWEIADQQARG